MKVLTAQYYATGMLMLAVILTVVGRWILPRMGQVWIPAGLAYEGLLVITLLLEWSAQTCPWTARGIQLVWCLFCFGKLLCSIWHSFSHDLVCSPLDCKELCTRVDPVKVPSCPENVLACSPFFETLSHKCVATGCKSFCMTGLQAHWMR